MKLGEVLYPTGLQRNDCREKVQGILDSYQVRQPVNGLEAGTVNLIAYWTEYYNLHPALLLATIKMEQPSVFTPETPSTWACEALCGVVGQDAAGTSRADLLSIGMQIYRASMGYAWSLNETPTAMFGRAPGWHLSWTRYTPGLRVQLDDTGFPMYTPADAVEYALLKHCPHIGRVADAQEKWNEFISFFQ